MEVILTEDIKSLGKAGDVVKVKEGYGRNYLLPKKKALVADKSNIKAVEAQKKMIEARRAKLLETAQDIATRLASLEITIEKEVGTGDRLFGSVTKMEIVEALQKEGIKIDKHLIEIESPIKAIGEYDITVKLSQDVTGKFKLVVAGKS